MATEPAETVFITVVGDSGVGKTSLITAAATETFPDHPPPVLPPARLPADTTPEGVPVVITDTSSRPEDKQALESACREASVIVLCFSMEKPQTLRRVSTHWLPELRRLGTTVPILLVGCKSDLRAADQSLHQAVLPIVKTFPQIETCMECSSRKLQFVGEVFYYALKSVVHPMAPLYEPEAQKLRPLCARALKRIFMWCDYDGDGVLNDAELDMFQIHCFNTPLQSEELAGVKQVVTEKCEDGIVRGGLTLKGFLFLHALFIERGRLETTWAVLRKFGYANNLRLRDDVTRGKAPQRSSADQVVELTPAGRAFFTETFNKFDVDKDGALSVKEREEMFSTAPEDPWKAPQYEGILVEISKRNGFLTLQGYLSLLAYAAATDPEAVLASAVYLGFPVFEPLQQLLTVSKPRQQERRGQDGARGLLHCLVFGGAGVDTRPVLEGLITQARPAHGAHTGPASAAVAVVSLPAPSSSTADAAAAEESSDAGAPSAAASPTAAASASLTLVLRSMTDEQAGALLVSPDRAAELQRCDAAVFAFDGCEPETFRSAMEQMVAVATAAGDALPCVLLCFNEEHMAPAVAAEVGEACAALRIRLPVAFPATAGLPSSEAAAALAPVYQAVVSAALKSEASIPETPSLRAKKQHRRMLRRAALLAAGASVSGLGLYFAYRWYHGKGKSSSGHELAATAGSSGEA